MFGVSIIVFREVFEIAIIMCVILAATKQLPNKRTYILSGIGLGIIGALLFAGLTQFLSNSLGKSEKLYFDISIIFIAVVMIAWTVVWMKKHGKQITNNIKGVSRDVTIGEKPLSVLALIIGLAVFREGSEIVIFIYGLLAIDKLTWITVMLGGLLGLGLGCLFGILLYLGLLKISIKYLFQIPSILLTLIACGMSANIAGKLVKANILNPIVDSMWNTTHLVPQHSIVGSFLHTLIGYQANPNAMQVIFYLSTLAIILYFSQRVNNPKTELCKT